MFVVANETCENVAVAVAYRDGATGCWISQGWWHIAAFERCSPFESAHLPVDLHVHARTAGGRDLTSADSPGQRFRVKNEPFRIERADRRTGDVPVFESVTGADDVDYGPAVLHRVVMPETSRAENALSSMIGLDTVKELVLRRRAWMEVQLKRREFDHLSPPPIRLHMAFKGKPGTGKTTVARIFGDIYKGLGLLDSGHMIEVDGRGLIAGFVGQTAARTTEVIESALGGVLFIDEAYALFQRDTPQDYGREAIATLVKGMEDHMHELAVILAGYPAEIEEMLSSNRGLLSRIQSQIDFPDYSPSQLFSILELLVRSVGTHLTQDSESLLRQIFTELCTLSDAHFGNARLVETLFQAMDEARSSRVINGGLDCISEPFRPEDVPPHIRSLVGA